MTRKQYIDYKSLQTLHFDPANPRLPSTVDVTNEEAVLQWMLEDANIIELMLSIGKKGYFPGEALLVVPHDMIADHYHVIEGNRRLTAVKLLLYPQLAPIRKKAVEQASIEANYYPEELPTIEFSRREDILNYLGYRHITGIKTWGALAKAKYLNQLSQAFSDQETVEQQHRELAKAIGSRASHVARQLAGYKVYEKIVEDNFFNIKGLNEESIDFSILTTALNYQNISRFIGMNNSQDQELEHLDAEHLSQLTSWLFEKNAQRRTRLGESRNLGNLNSVLGHQEALEHFRNGEPLTSAVLYTEVPSEIFQRAILEAKSRLELARNYIHLIDRPTDVDSQNLLEIQKLARSLKSVIEDRLIEL